MKGPGQGIPSSCFKPNRHRPSHLGEGCDLTPLERQVCEARPSVDNVLCSSVYAGRLGEVEKRPNPSLCPPVPLGTVPSCLPACLLGFGLRLAHRESTPAQAWGEGQAGEPGAQDGKGRKRTALSSSCLKRIWVRSGGDRYP